MSSGTQMSHTHTAVPPPTGDAGEPAPATLNSNLLWPRMDTAGTWGMSDRPWASIAIWQCLCSRRCRVMHALQGERRRSGCSRSTIHVARTHAGATGERSLCRQVKSQTRRPALPVVPGRSVSHIRFLTSGRPQTKHAPAATAKHMLPTTATPHAYRHAHHSRRNVHGMRKTSRHLTAAAAAACASARACGRVPEPRTSLSFPRCPGGATGPSGFDLVTHKPLTSSRQSCQSNHCDCQWLPVERWPAGDIMAPALPA